MDRLLLDVFRLQIKLQLQAVQLAADDLQQALDAPGNAARNPRTWASIQSLLTAAANVSKALWGQGGKPMKIERGPIRERLAVLDQSPFRSVGMRNNYDHFDERIEAWWETSSSHRYLGECLVHPDSKVELVFLDRDRFRTLDPVNWIAGFWGQEFDLRAICTEAQRILSLIDGSE